VGAEKSARNHRLQIALAANDRLAAGINAGGPGKPTWRYLNRLSLSSAWLAPLIRGSLNSAHIHRTDVPVEEPSTASNSSMGGFYFATKKKSFFAGNEL
jgi:hypothetical protein